MVLCFVPHFPLLIVIVPCLVHFIFYWEKIYTLCFDHIPPISVPPRSSPPPFLPSLLLSESYIERRNFFIFNVMWVRQPWFSPVPASSSPHGCRGWLCGHLVLVRHFGKTALTAASQNFCEVNEAILKISRKSMDISKFFFHNNNKPSMEPGTVMHSSSPRTWETEPRELRVWEQPGLRMSPCFKN